MKKLYKLLVLMMVMAIGFTGCANNSDKTNSNEKTAEKTESKESKEDSKAKENYEISFSGSSTLAPVISKISTTFIEKNVTWDKVDSSLPDKNITIYVSAGGSGVGVKAVLDNVANFGMLARDVKDKEKDKNENYQVKKLYLNPYLDMYNSEIISYEISKQPTLEPILKALDRAIEITNINKDKRIFHSDQGWAYQIKQYTSKLEAEGITQSMSRKGNCLDNSPMENFFGILKQEIYYGKKFYSYEELKETIEEYIEYYNKDRIKEKLGYLSPIEYREKNAA